MASGTLTLIEPMGPPFCETATQWREAGQMFYYRLPDD